MKARYNRNYIRGTGNIIYLLPASNFFRARTLAFARLMEFCSTQEQARLPLLKSNSNTTQEPTSSSGNSMDQ